MDVHFLHLTEMWSQPASFPVFFRGGPAQAGPKDFSRPLLAALLAILLLPVRPAAAERLTYALSWGLLPVGEMVLETRPGPFLGAPVLHATLTARSNAFVDLFLPVLNIYATRWDQAADRSLHFERTISEGRRNASSELLLDSPLPRYLLLEEGRVANVLDAAGPLHDPLSLLLSLRREALFPGAVAQRPTTDGRNTALAQAAAKGWAEVDTPLGRYRAVEVEVDMAGVEGLFGIRGRIVRIWAAPGAGNLPVMVESRVRLGPWSGTVTARLRAAEPDN